jgi:carbamoyl-phosphate synthase large subunit
MAGARSIATGGAANNVLLLSAGRRVSLARLLRRSAEAAGGRLIAADLRPEWSAACVDNGVSAPLPRVDAETYPDALRALCAAHRIGLVVPTIDTELAVLARLRDSFAAAGIRIAVSDPALIAAARDKRQTALYFERFGVESPPVLDAGRLTYPAIAKPADGSLSRDIAVLRGPEDLTPKVLRTPNLMFAAYLEHTQHDEFTCDAYYAADGGLRCVVPRQRVEVRGGEVSKGRAVKNDIVPMFFEKLARIEGAQGCLTFQFFRHRETGRHWLIELNPRFGGGYPLTAAAGAPYHDWLVRETFLGVPPPMKTDWTDGLVMLRYDAEVFHGG